MGVPGAPPCAARRRASPEGCMQALHIAAIWSPCTPTSIRAQYIEIQYRIGTVQGQEHYGIRAVQDGKSAEDCGGVCVLERGESVLYHTVHLLPRKAHKNHS